MDVNYFKSFKKPKAPGKILYRARLGCVDFDSSFLTPVALRRSSPTCTMLTRSSNALESKNCSTKFTQDERARYNFKKENSMSISETLNRLRGSNTTLESARNPRSHSSRNQLFPTVVPVSLLQNALRDKHSVAPVRQPNPIHFHPFLLPDLSAFDKPAPYHTTMRESHLSKKTDTPSKSPLSSPTRLPVNPSINGKLLLTTPPRTTITNPGIPEREIPSPIRNSVALKPPHFYHHAKTLQSPEKFPSKLKKVINKLEKNLNDKQRHSVILSDSPLKNDIPKILNGAIKPDRHGVFKVPDSNGDPRIWGMHIKPSPSASAPPTATLYPMSGKDIVPFTGPQLQAELASYRKDKENRGSISFAEHIKTHVKVEKVKKRKKPDDESVAPSSGSGSLGSISAPGPSLPSTKDQPISSPATLSNIQPVEKDATQGIDTPQEKSTEKQWKIAHEEPLLAPESNGSQREQSSSSQMDQELLSPSLRLSSQVIPLSPSEHFIEDLQ